MTSISDIDEIGINRNLKVRYDRDQIYVSFLNEKKRKRKLNNKIFCMKIPAISDWLPIPRLIIKYQSLALNQYIMKSTINASKMQRKLKSFNSIN